MTRLDEVLEMAIIALINAQENYGEHWPDVILALREALTHSDRQPLTEAEIADIVVEMNGNEPTGLFWRDLTRAIEAAHGIGKKT